MPLSFLLALTFFILRHIQDSEFVILWTSGVKKIQVVNLFFLPHYLFYLFIYFFYFFNTFALNKSRQLLSNDNLNSFLPTIKNTTV